ncbi:SGNH/GDSL hydrolase family protein [Nonomuraea sp. NPDC049784]|uniref:SGNH/GDSL hydrolase family protein n=1 Tax=Nonomuraea sp. NPDC049784 TaxID=3154361 RepID=UPI0033E704E8
MPRRASRLRRPAPPSQDEIFRYQANAVVINLGTNDVGHGVSTTTFQASYTHLLQEVRAAAIFALETFTRRYATQTRTTPTSPTSPPRAG